MTCVIAISDGKTITAGADSALGSSEEVYTFDDQEKVFLRGPFLFGYCGSALVGQLLRYEVELPESPPDVELTPFLVREIVPAIRRAVVASGTAETTRTILGEKTVVMVGCRGGLWCLTPDLAVTKTMPHAAIGSGRHHAYGALHALAASEVQPAERRIELALRAAAAFTPTVRAPFHFVTLEA